uniref:collectin-12-like n=1 Tax=Styela clava TaxID=7725 RepID=UPI00193A1772|nr:collectin-12-like [Styela clava]
MLKLTLMLCLVFVVTKGIIAHDTCSVNYDETTSKMHFELDWVPNTQGMPGRPGKRGVQGQKGERGFQGVAGVRGEKGERGLNGEKGSKGNNGHPGPKGEVSQEYLANLEAKMLKFVTLPWVEVNERFSYFSSSFSMTWEKGKTYCEERNAHLAYMGPRDSGILNSIEGNLKLIARHNFYWIGLKRQANGNYQWTDGVVAERNPWTTTVGCPGSGDCVGIHAGCDKLSRASCSWTMKVLCEIDFGQQ